MAYHVLYRYIPCMEHNGRSSVTSFLYYSYQSAFKLGERGLKYVLLLLIILATAFRYHLVHSLTIHYCHGTPTYEDSAPSHSTLVV